MAAPVGHIHGSERETPPWICCVPTSGNMFIHDVLSAAIPVSLSETHTLRKACGALHPTAAQIAAGANPGVTNTQLRAGLKALYGYTVPHYGAGASALFAALPSGSVACISGLMGVFPLNHRLRRFDAAFIGRHKVWLYNDGGKLWWDNPLAPVGTYNGEPVTKAEVQLYVDGIPDGGAWIAAPRKADEPVTVATMTEKFTPSRALTYKAGTRRWNATGEALPPMASDGAATANGRWTFEQSDNHAPNGSGFLQLDSGGSSGKWLVEADVTLAPAPPVTPPTQDELTASYNAGVDAASSKAKEAKKGA